MVSKDINDLKKHHIDHKLNIISKTRIKNTTLQEKSSITARSALGNDKNIIVKPIINLNNNNNNDSNTSIKASNKKICNLIGKMINDVSKKSTISGLDRNKQNNKATITAAATTTTTTAAIITGETPAITRTSGTNTGTTTSLTKYSLFNCSEGGNKFTHNNNHFHNNNSKRNFQITNLNEPNRENLSFVNEENPNDLISKREEAKGENLAVTVKAPLYLQNFNSDMRHKNITIVPFDDSYHRTVDLDAALNARQQHNSQCELLELNRIDESHPQKDYKTTNCELKFLSLAERKALLKKEFFKDLNTSTSTATAAATNLVKLKTNNNQTLNKRILKKQHNLKLKIPKDCNKAPHLLEQEKPKVDLSLSLVALRKLDLQKKQQTDLKSAHNSLNKTAFPRVKELAKKFDLKGNTMILPQTNLKEDATKTAKLLNMQERQSPMSDEGCNIGQSPYSSDDDNDSIRTTNTAIQRLPNDKRKDKVARSASSDSALGLEVDEPMDVGEQPQPQQQKRRMTLTVTDLPLRPALLPLAEPTLLPDSPILDTPLPILANNLQQNQIPSKVLLEERVVEIPEDPRSGMSSRRESSQSCFSDFPPGEMQGVRFVRTPSVVVSDYSDDVTCGITLEEIEYFRAQRLRRRRSSLETSGTEKDALDNNSDISASSSCSNLYYCGSTISALDGAECLVNGVRQQLERKTSDCSTCSVSGDEDSGSYFCIPEQPEDCQDITDMLANQHLTNKRSKKVGMANNILSVDPSNVV